MSKWGQQSSDQGCRCGRYTENKLVYRLFPKFGTFGALLYVQKSVKLSKTWQNLEKLGKKGVNPNFLVAALPEDGVLHEAPPPCMQQSDKKMPSLRKEVLFEQPTEGTHQKTTQAKRFPQLQVSSL